MNPSTPSDPTSTSVPGGPLGRYLLHPGSDTSTVVHHVLHVLADVGRAALPFLVAVVVLVIVARLVLTVTRRQKAGGGHVVTVGAGTGGGAARCRGVVERAARGAAPGWSGRDHLG